jgi:hypothetical protein
LVDKEKDLTAETATADDKVHGTAKPNSVDNGATETVVGIDNASHEKNADPASSEGEDSVGSTYATEQAPDSSVLPRPVTKPDIYTGTEHGEPEETTAGNSPEDSIEDEAIAKQTTVDDRPKVVPKAADVLAETDAEKLKGDNDSAEVVSTSVSSKAAEPTELEKMQEELGDLEARLSPDSKVLADETPSSELNSGAVGQKQNVISDDSSASDHPQVPRPHGGTENNSTANRTVANKTDGAGTSQKGKTTGVPVENVPAIMAGASWFIDAFTGDTPVWNKIVQLVTGVDVVEAANKTSQDWTAGSFSDGRPAESKELDDRFNYANFDVGARVLQAHKDTKGARNVLIFDPDTYMSSRCNLKKKWIVFELSELILVEKLTIGNFEQ